jgi:ferric-dicitrate binding protein FerR (iron transport regulator)
MNRQIYEEASEWIVELGAGDVDQGARERLDAWLRTSPQHIQAFLELAGLWEECSDPDLDQRNSKELLMARACDSINVIALESATPPQAPLADVALEFNRYNARQLVVHDAQLEQFHVTGIFSSTDPASLVRFLRAQPGIDVEETSGEIRISSK